MDGSSDRFRDEPDTKDPSKKPIARMPSDNLAHHHRSLSVGRSTTASQSRSSSTGRHDNLHDGPNNNKGPTRNKKTKTKKQVTTTTKTVKTRKIQQKGGRIIREDVEETPAVIETVVRDSSERSSIYTGRSDRDEEDDSFRRSGLTYGGTRNKNDRVPSIYEAYRRLSSMPRDEAMGILQEEEHSSNNTFSQQTPATSASTQPSTEEDDHSHFMAHSPSSSPPQASTSSQRSQKKKSSSSRKQPTNMRIETPQTLEKQPSGRRQRPDEHQMIAISSDNPAPYQRKNSSKSKTARRESNTIDDGNSNGGSIPKQLHVVGQRADNGSRNGTKPRRTSQRNQQQQPQQQIVQYQQPQQQQAQVDTKNGGVPEAQQLVAQLHPAHNIQHAPEPRSIIRRVDAEQAPVPSSAPLKESLHSGNLDVEYSHRMLQVQDSLLTSIQVKKTKNRSDTSYSSSSSSSSRSRKGIRDFFGMKGHAPLTEEQRRIRGNPFLNRPKSVKKFTHIGVYESDDDSSHDQRRRSDSGSDFDDTSIDGSGRSHKHKTFQQKYCPLPKPVKMLQRFCGKIVTKQEFQIFMVVLIMLNALILGLATYDYGNPRIPEAFDIMDRILLVIFTIELALQLGYCGYTLLLDGWLVFDTLTVVTSWWLEGVQVFRSFRIFRSFRLIVRLPLLKNLVLTVFHVMPRIYSILGLMLLILYIFGVLCTILFGDLYERQLIDKNYFGRLDYSVFTLFQMITLEGWGDIVRQVAAVHEWYASLIFSTFIVVTGFIMYNLIVAVMCDSMLVVEAQGREEAREQKQQKLMLEELAKGEEEKKLEAEMVRQREIAHGSRIRAKGLVDDDSTLDGQRDRQKDGDGSLDNITEEDEESIVQMRSHMCENCGFCSEMAKFSIRERRKKRERVRLMEENQDRVRGLKQKIDQLAGTQQQVTAVLQTLMFEIEAQRKASSYSSRSFSSRPETTEASLEEDRLE